MIMNNYNCKNIFSGFQALHPRLFVLLGEVLGDILGKELPFNVQNALGCWLQCAGDIIITYTSKQLYFQRGPGRYYDIRYKNTNNPFCTKNINTTERNSSSGSFSDILASQSYFEDSLFASTDDHIENDMLEELDNKLKHLELEALNLKSQIEEL